jgi:hypothetical protein
MFNGILPSNIGASKKIAISWTDNEPINEQAVQKDDRRLEHCSY